MPSQLEYGRTLLMLQTMLRLQETVTPLKLKYRSISTTDYQQQSVEKFLQIPWLKSQNSLFLAESDSLSARKQTSAVIMQDVTSSCHFGSPSRINLKFIKGSGRLGCFSPFTHYGHCGQSCYLSLSFACWGNSALYEYSWLCFAGITSP